MSDFACAIDCIDGRTTEPVCSYIKRTFGVKYIDKVTEPGPNKILADNSDEAVINSIRRRVDISVNHHGSKVIAIIGHFGCAGNPAEKEEQIKHLQAAQKTVESFGFQAEVILLWVNGDWQTVEKIDGQLAEAA